MNEHLRLFAGEAVETLPAPRGKDALQAALTAFRDASGWELYTELVDDFDRLPDTSRYAQHEVRVVPCTQSPDAVRIDRDKAQRLALAIQSLSSELQSTRRALVNREAELAAGVPVATHPNEREHLAARLRGILRDAARLLGCQAAGVYLLDGDHLRLKLRAAWRIPQQRLLASPRSLEASAADLQALSDVPVVIQGSDSSGTGRAPESCRAALCVRIASTTLPLGTLWFFSRRERRFREKHLELARLVAGRIAAELEREMLLAETQRLTSLRSQLDEVARIEQRATLTPPQLDPWSIAGWSRRPHGLGAAFHAWDVARDASVWISVGECGGRRLVGAQRAAALAASVRAIWPRTKSPAALLTETNRLLWRREAGDAVATVASARLNDAGEVLLSVAGDPCVLLVSDSGAKELVDIEPPLGLASRLKPAERKLELPRGAAIVIATSGVRDALDERGRLFGTKGIAQALRAGFCNRAQTLADLLRDRLESHVASNVDADSTAVVICRR